MAKNTDLSQMYLKYLHLVQSIRALPSFPDLDAVEVQMLNTLATAWFKEKKMYVNLW